MLILKASDVTQALPMNQAIEAMKYAYAALSSGKAQVPLRINLAVPPHQGMSLFMPAYVDAEGIESLVVKAVSVFPNNQERGLPLIHAAVLVLDASTGRPDALVEGGRLTAIRTGAASGAATDLLAPADARVAAIFGAGIQGHTQLEAICAVRSIESAWIYDTSQQRVEEFIAELAGKGSIPRDLRIAQNPQQALQDADVVCTATTSASPVFRDSHLKRGVHINAVGAYTPQMQEIPSDTVARARIVVDSRTASLVEAGDLVIPIQSGLISAAQIYAELGEIVLGQKAGRSAADQLTLFKSVGLAAQDAAAASLALQNARAHGIGQEVVW